MIYHFTKIGRLTFRPSPEPSAPNFGCSRTLLTPALSEMAGMMGAMGGMGDGMKEAAKKAVEDEIAAKAPGSIKPFFPCLGGPVPTVETCMCMVPADQQDSVKQAIEKYKSL